MVTKRLRCKGTSKVGVVDFLYDENKVRVGCKDRDGNRRHCNECQYAARWES